MTLKWTPKWLTVFVAAALALTLVPAQGRCDGEGWSIFDLLASWAQPQPVKPVCCPTCPLCPEGTCLGAITMPNCPVAQCPACEKPATAVEAPSRPDASCSSATQQAETSPCSVNGITVEEFGCEIGLQAPVTSVRSASGVTPQGTLTPDLGVVIRSNTFGLALPACGGCPATVPQACECPAGQPACGASQCQGNCAECPLRRALTDNKLNLSFNEVSLADCLRTLAEFAANITFVTDDAAIDRAGVRLDRPVTLNATDASLECCLSMLLKPFNLTHVVENQAITITTPDHCGAQSVMPYAPSSCQCTPDCGSCVPLMHLPVQGQTTQANVKVYVPLIRPVRVQGLTVFDAQPAGCSTCTPVAKPVSVPGMGRIIFTLQQPCPGCCEPGVCHVVEPPVEEMRRISCEQQRSIRELCAAVLELSQEIRSLREEIQVMRTSGNSQFKPSVGASSAQPVRFIYVQPETSPNVIFHGMLPPIPR